jgi:DNA-directed RNA polymerase specialized sigma24 family protein
MLFWRPTEEVNEERLVLNAQSGDRWALDKLLKRYEIPLFRHVYRIVADEQAAYDILQETFIIVAKNIAKLQFRDKYKAWVFGTATRVALRGRQKISAREASEIDVDVPDRSLRALELVLEKEKLQQILSSSGFSLFTSRWSCWSSEIQCELISCIAA